MTVLLATRNRGKLAELAELFRDSPIELRLPADEGFEMPAVEETGSSFEENALLKARALAHASGFCALADDSGLEVDALGGDPGVRSARYAGANASDQANCEKLLREIAMATGERTRGCFRCVLALVRPDGRYLTAEGSLAGEIATAPAGDEGFGYDPVFLIPERGLTVAQMSFREKQNISHRRRAADNLKKLLPSFLKD